jgi:hypothetical protein
MVTSSPRWEGLSRHPQHRCRLATVSRIHLSFARPLIAGKKNLEKIQKDANVWRGVLKLGVFLLAIITILFRRFPISEELHEQRDGAKRDVCFADLDLGWLPFMSLLVRRRSAFVLPACG